MPTKPHRVLMERVSGYADEAAAYLRRRRHLRKPFARTYYAGGRSTSFPDDTDAGKFFNRYVVLGCDIEDVEEALGP